MRERMFEVCGPKPIHTGYPAGNLRELTLVCLNYSSHADLDPTKPLRQMRKSGTRRRLPLTFATYMQLLYTSPGDILALLDGSTKIYIYITYVKEVEEERHNRTKNYKVYKPTKKSEATLIQTRYASKR